MKYLYFWIRVSRTWRKLPLNFQVHIQKPWSQQREHLTSSNSKPLSVLLFVPLFLANLDKKYAKETDMDKN